MSNKILGDAFAYYVSLGPERSYEAVAKRYVVSKRAVTKCARKERWSERLAEIEKDAQERTDKKLALELEEVRGRHRKMLRAMAARAAKAIAEMPLESGMDGIRAAQIAINLERVMFGEPTDRTEMTVSSAIKREMEQLLRPPGEKVDGQNDW